MTQEETEDSIKRLREIINSMNTVNKGQTKTLEHLINVNDGLIAEVARLEKKISELDEVHRLIANTLIDQIKLNNELLRSNAANGEVIPHLRIVK